MSQVTYFTPWNRESADPKIFFEGNQIPVEKEMKILGVIYDIHHTFTPHMKTQSAKARSSLRIVKAVMGADWGFNKEDGLLTYRALISPVLGYAAPVWLPARSLLKHIVAPLQAVQNAALRSITGCHAASSVQHLHDECEMMQVFDHLAMQSSQFLANTRQPNHPSHAITSRPPGPRPDRKPTLQRAFGKVVEPFSTDGVIMPVSYKRVIGSIHTDAVKGALAKRAPNRVLGVIPPKIHHSEATLRPPCKPP
jgi:hypothetical protein